MTGTPWVSLYVPKILSIAALGEQLEDPTRAAIKQAWADVWGAGGCFGAPVWNVYASDSIDLDAPVDCYTGDGRRLQLTTDPTAGFYRVPYVDDGTLRYLGARYSEIPTGAELGIDGSLHYAGYLEGIGEQLAPSAVSNPTATTTRLVLTGTLPAGMKWTNMAETRPAIAWLSTPATASSQAVYAGDLVYDGVKWYVDVPHVFGQATPSTTPGDYVVQVVGLTIGTIGIVSDPAYVFLGTAQDPGSLTFDTSGVTVIDHVSSWIAAFAVEHDGSTGHHTSVTGVDSAWKPGANTSPGVAIKATDGVARVLLIPGDESLTGGAGILRFPHPELSPDHGVSLDVGPYNGSTLLRLTNSYADAGASTEIVVDGVITKTLSKSAAWKLRVVDGSDHTLIVDNGGAGLASLSIKGGALVRVDGGGYGYRDGDHLVNVDVSPFQGGWTVVAGPGDLTIDNAGTPPLVQSSSGTDPFTAIRGLPELQQSNMIGGRLYTIASITWTYQKIAAAGLTLVLRRAKRDGTGAAATVQTIAGLTTTGFEVHTVAINHDADPAYSYWLALAIDPDAAVTDAQLGALVLNLAKSRVE